MELFKRRYICFICFAFVVTAFGLTFYGDAVKIATAIIAALALVVSGVVFVKKKNRRFEALFALLISLAVSISAFTSYFFVSRAIKEAKSLLGENTVQVRIVSRIGEKEYNARLLRAGEREVDIKSELIFETDASLEYGDELIMNADIELSDDTRDYSKLLAIAASDESKVYINRAEVKNYFSADGLSALCSSLQNAFSNHVDKTFGDHSALAKGLLVNDTSDIDAKTQTDFRRSGTSHILAVSGMHIALLMGAVELLLRKIEVKKEIRIVLISILSIFFLALTGFVASAVRSVLMLFAVYVCYIFYEENDSITALFASIAIIILFSPFSVYDLGMWMSFLATLGILAVYPYFDERMPYPKQKNLFVRYSLRLLVWVAKTLMLTVIANFFLLLIMWSVFGVASLSTLPCNLILAPIVTVLMPLCALSTVLGFIPYVSIPFVFVTNKLFDVMMSIVRYFSEIRLGMVSLKYEFAGILIVLFAVVVSVMLVISFKHKLLIFAPMISFVVVFAICLSVFNLNSRPTIWCARSGDAEMIFIGYASECSVVDVGENNTLSGKRVTKYMSKYATEIDEYFITTLDEGDAATIEGVCKNTVIRKLYIPKIVDSTELAICYDILKCAEKYNISVEVYENGDNVEICNGVLFSHSEDDVVSIKSDKVEVKKENQIIVCSYKDIRYEVQYKDYLSKEIPLN